MSFEDDLKDTTSGAVGETRTLTGVTPQRPQRCASTIPPRPHAMVGEGRLDKLFHKVKSKIAQIKSLFRFV